MLRRIASLIVLAAAAAVPAQAAVTVRGLDSSRLPIVRLTVAVDTARPGAAPVFEVTENGRPVGGLAISAPSASAAVALAIDTSGSMYGAPLQKALGSATDFLDHLKQGDEGAVFGFGHTATMPQGLTADTTVLRAAVAGLSSDTVQGTAVNDAALLAVRELARSKADARRVLVLLTDGKDSSSTAKLADVITAASKAGVSIYTIALHTGSYTPGSLQELSAATGGTFHDADQAGLGRVYTDIAQELQQTFVLTYRTGESKHVDVAITADGQRTTTGYVGGATPAILRPGLVPAAAVLPAWSTYAIAGVTFGLLLVGALLVFRPRPRRSLSERLDAYNEFSKRAKVADDLDTSDRTSLMVQLARSTERILGGLNFWKTSASLIERADLPLRTGELFYMQLGSALLFGMPAGYAGTIPLFTLVLFVFGFFVPLLVVKFKARGRQKAFDNQLPDALTAMAASLKVGHSWNQAMDTIVKEGADPMKAEFSRVASEVRLGRASDDALESMAKRIGSADFEFVTMSVNIQRQVGGSLADLLDQVAETVRLRQQFRTKVKALTSMGRMSAYTLIGMPFMMGLGIYAMNPSYMDPLLYTGTGHFLMLIALVSMSLGGLLLKKIVSFKS
jgi:tight adherence protein B